MWKDPVCYFTHVDTEQDTKTVTLSMDVIFFNDDNLHSCIVL